MAILAIQFRRKVKLKSLNFRVNEFSFYEEVTFQIYVVG